MNNKRGAMELSIGTIVIIVLAMSMLILGIILVKNIFEGSNKIIDMSEENILAEMQKIYGNDKEVTLFPNSKLITVKQGEINGFAIGLRNRKEAGTFSYDVVVSDPDLQRKCGVSEQTVISWIETGRSENNIQLGPGDDTAMRVLVRVPEGSALCTFRLRVNVKKGGQSYASEAMDVEIRA